jgi:putative hydrolase of the HAD superfamily
MGARFDAVLFDAGGVLVLPDPTVLAPLLAPYGGDPSIDAHRRAHYAAMAVKSRVGSVEMDWTDYNLTYVDSVGCRPEIREHAAEVLDHTRSAHLWRWAIPETLVALAALADAGVPMGVVSNASGQIEAVLRHTEVCSVDGGRGVRMRVVVDSHVVGVAKPDPAIFEHALPHFAEFDRHRIAYVGDSVAMDVSAARGAGLHPLLIDPYGDHDGADFETVRSVEDVLSMV